MIPEKKYDLKNYSWAFFIVVILIGALIYFSLVNPCFMGSCEKDDNRPPKITSITCEKITPPTKVIITDEGKDIIYYEAKCDYMEKEEWLWCIVK